MNRKGPIDIWPQIRPRTIPGFFCVWSLFNSFAIISLRKRELVALLCVLAARWLSLCSVSQPHSAVGWSVDCDCGISWSYLLIFIFFESGAW